MQMINVNVQMLKFRHFLLNSWKDLDHLMENHDWDEDMDFIDDWLQVNWEFLVERELLGKKAFLKSYAYSNFRITCPNAIAAYKIICMPKPGKQLIDHKTKLIIPSSKGTGFAGFVSKTNGGYGCYPPFDYATVFTLDRKNYFMVGIQDVDFYMCPTEIT